MLRRRCCAPQPVVAEPLEARRVLAATVAGFAEESFVASGINRATQMDFAPDGRLFVSQQDGKLRVVKAGQLLPTPFVTVPVNNTGESGLIGVTFDPAFATNKFVYIYYTYKEASTGAFWNRVSRFTANGDVAEPGSEVVIFEGDALGPGTWHNSGCLKFGPDGKLYISMGENQKPTEAQDLNSLLGKILRINSDGTIPGDNPFFGTLDGKYRAIYAYGLRNAYTFDIQAGTGRILVSDVGSDKWEEVNELQAGANYGWPVVEGPSSNPAYKAPLYAYPHAGGDFDDSAITGAAFYDPPSPTYPADYAGDYFFGDYNIGGIHKLDATTNTVTTFATGLIGVTDLDVGPDGSLYALIRAASGPNGRVVRFVPVTASSPPTISAQPTSLSVVVGQPATFNVTAVGESVTYQWSRNGVDIPGATGTSYSVPSTLVDDTGSRFRVAVSNAFGTVFSDEATLTVVAPNAGPVATIDLPADGTLWTGGGTINFSGTAIDPEDGPLPASAFTWSVDLQHDTHAHPFIAPYSGVTADTIQVPPASHDAEHNIWYRIHLTVTDSDGITHSTFRDVYPQKVNLSLRTEPAGLMLDLDGSPVTAPYDSPAIVGFTRPLSAPRMQTVGGVQYVFDGWLDDTGAPVERELTIPAANVAYTAKYVPVSNLEVAMRATSLPPSAMGGTKLPGRTSVAITNRGATSSAGAVTVRLVLALADDPDTEVAQVATVTKSMTLASGKAKTVKFGALTLPTNVPAGNYVLQAHVTAPDGSPSLVPAGQAIAVVAPTIDLVAADLQPMSRSDVPQSLEKFRLTVTNAGNVPMRGPVEVDLIASTDAMVGGEDDVVIGRVTLSVNLAPGRSQTLKFSTTYPTTLPSGVYSVFAKLDPQALLGESDAAFANNTVIGRQPIRTS